MELQAEFYPVSNLNLNTFGKGSLEKFIFEKTDSQARHKKKANLPRTNSGNIRSKSASTTSLNRSTQSRERKKPIKKSSKPAQFKNYMKKAHDPNVKLRKQRSGSVNNKQGSKTRDSKNEQNSRQQSGGNTISDLANP